MEITIEIEENNEYHFRKLRNIIQKYLDENCVDGGMGTINKKGIHENYEGFFGNPNAKWKETDYNTKKEVQERLKKVV